MDRRGLIASSAWAADPVKKVLFVTHSGGFMHDSILVAENVRKADRISPLEAIRRATAVRVRPVVMTALATFFALIPMSLGLSHGSEANVPLGRAVLGGLLAGLVTTLFMVPCLYALVVPDRFEKERLIPGAAGPTATP